MNNKWNVNKKHKLAKLVVICIILTLFTYVFIDIINVNSVEAAVQTREAYSNKIDNYKGYKEQIEKLKKEHPNWNFTIFYTGLDWYQVIKNETSAYHGRNVVPSSKSSAWKCSVCGDTPHGGTSWRCASESAVSYYMDPRNWLNEEDIFQFENLSFNEKTQTLEGVEKIISGIKYMKGDKASYTKTDATKATLDKSYAQIIMDAAKEAGISPYHLASRIRQEQGAGDTPGSTATGTYAGYTGYYNFLNIKASGSTDAEVIKNGLEHAKNNNWNNPEISIKEGAKVLAKNYIKDGQDTLYLQKFDVDNSDGTLYYFQYMQNVSAALTEGQSVKDAYEDLNLLKDSTIEFIIPVYENMPDTACEQPIDGAIVTQNIKIKGTKVNVRSAPNTKANVITEVNTGDTLLRIEKAATKVDNYYWDKIVLANGEKGYIVRDYIVEIADITNCNDIVVANTAVNLRNGPGTSNTTIITMLTNGQVLTRIEKGKYTVDGYVWDRVKLADGRQGYIAQNYIDLVGQESSDTTTELIKVTCNSGLKVREQPGTTQKVLMYLDKGDVLTRTQKAVSTTNGYTWDKVVTAEGIEGYIARGDSKEQYVEIVNSISGNTQTGTNDKNDDFKLIDSNLVCEPNSTIEVIKEKYTNKNVVVTKADGTTVSSGNIATGYIITIENKKYTTVKIGDTNGDGKINSTDALEVLKQSVNILNKQGCYLEAMDVNKDGKVNSADALLILKGSVGTEKISI